jgi:integrase/recombinase XerD
MKPLDIKWKDRTALVSGKFGRERLVPLGQPAIAALQAYLKDGRPVFRKHGSPFLFISSISRHLSRSWACYMVSAHATIAKIQIMFTRTCYGIHALLTC